MAQELQSDNLDKSGLREELEMILRFKKKLEAQRLETLNDIVEYYNALLEIGDEFVSSYFDSFSEESLWSIEERMNEPEKEEGSDEEDESPRYRQDERELLQGPLSYFFTTWYFSLQGGTHPAIRFKIEIPKNDDNELEYKLRDIVIYTTVKGIPYIATLDQVSKDYSNAFKVKVVEAFQQIHTAIVWRLFNQWEGIKHYINKQMHVSKQLLLEGSSSATISWLLMSPWDRSLEKSSMYWVATEEDFTDTIRPIDENLQHVYAEKYEHFYNLFLWFDIATWEIQKTDDKKKNFNDYFYEKEEETPVRLQNILKKSELLESSNHPSQIENIIQRYAGNLSSIITEKERLEQCMWQRSEYRDKTDSEKDQLLEKVMSLFKERNAVTPVEKREIVNEVMDPLREEYHRTWRQLQLPQESFASKTKEILNEKIFKAFKKFSVHGKPKYQVYHDLHESLTVEQKQRRELLINALKKQVDELGVSYFGKEYKLPELSLRATLHHWRYGAIVWSLIRDNLADSIKDHSERMKAIHKYTEELECLEDMWRELIHNTDSMYLLQSNLSVFDEIEKEIVAEEDKEFKRTTAAIEQILIAQIKQELHYHFYGRDFRNDKWEIISRAQENIETYISMFSELIKTRNLQKVNLTLVFESIRESIDGLTIYNIVKKLTQKYWIHPDLVSEKLIKGLQKEFEQRQYDGWFSIHSINVIEEIKQVAEILKIKLLLPTRPPIEEYYFYRLRTPETIFRKYRNENALSRGSGSFGYTKWDLQSLQQLEEFLHSMGLLFDRDERLNIDYREDMGIEPSNWFDISEIVPIKTGYSKVEVMCYGNRNEAGVTEWHYVMLFDEKKNLFKLLFDSTVMNGDLMQQKYKLYDTQIMGGGYMTFYKNKRIVEIKEHNETFFHEPRAVTIAAILNSLQKNGEQWKVFLWEDWYTEFSELRSA